MGSKKKNTAKVVEPALQAAPASAPEQEAAQSALAPNGNIIETAPAPEDEKVTRIKGLLKAYPALEAGYICGKGTYFDKAIAEKFLEEGEELIIVTLEKE